jgi:hypothetical protein
MCKGAERIESNRFSSWSSRWRSCDLYAAAARVSQSVSHISMGTKTPAMHTVILVVYSRAKISNLRPQVPNLLGLADGVGLLARHRFIHTFRGVAMGAACMTGLDAVTLTAGSPLAPSPGRNEGRLSGGGGGRGQQQGIRARDKP